MSFDARPVGAVEVLPALLHEKTLLPGERKSVYLRWDEQVQAVTAARRSHTQRLLVVLTERSLSALREIDVGTLAEVEQASSAVGRSQASDRQVNIFGLCAFRVEHVRRRRHFEVTGRRLFEPTGKLRTSTRNRLQRALRSHLMPFEIREADRMARWSDRQLILELAQRMRLDVDTELALLKASSLKEQVKILLPVRRGGSSMSEAINDPETEGSESDLPTHIRKALDEMDDLPGENYEAQRLVRSLKWTAPPAKPISLELARQSFSEFLGMEQVKEAILDLLAAWEWSRRRGAAPAEYQGRNLCLVGPPGVGKTGISRSIAEATSRHLIHVAMGGTDDIFLSGADQAYRKARPGEILRRLQQSGRHPSELVFVLDEIDKIPLNISHSPVGVLLALLDPEQRSAWQDHFLDAIRIDLSSSLFICTANDLTAIPAPLLDRLQPMVLPGYSKEEQVAIGKESLWPRVRRKYRLTDEVDLKDDVIAGLVRTSPEAPGMRQLLGQLERIAERAIRLAIETDGPVFVDLPTALKWVGSSGAQGRRMIGFAPHPKT